MATQGERRAETRQRLLDAAADLFASRGIEASSVDAIAEQADRTSGAIYDHFGGTYKVAFVHGIGCNYCSETGYRDRVGVYEVLAVTDEVRQLIVTNAAPQELRARAVEQGMRTMSHEAMALVAANVTTIDEVIHNVYVN